MFTREQYRWGYCNEEGTMCFSRIYDDYNECFDDYLEIMRAFRKAGQYVSLFKWRGVYTIEQCAQIVKDEPIDVY